MMSGSGMFAMMLWMPIGMLLCIVLVAVVIWFFVRWLNNGKISRMQYTLTPPQQNPYQPYEQGYPVPSQQEQETYQEGGQHYQYPEPQQPQQYEQPQVQYQQEQEMPPQH